MADTRFVSDKPLNFDCDLGLGRGNLNFVRNTPFNFVLSFYERVGKESLIKFLLSFFFSYG